MTPDFSGHKVSRERYQVHLRSEKRSVAAQNRRIQHLATELSQRQPKSMSVDFNVTEMLESGDKRERFIAIEHLKSLSASERTHRDIVTGGFVIQLLRILGEIEGNLQLQHDAMWCLAMIPANTEGYLQALLAAGAVPILVDLISPKNLSTAQLAMWMIANESSYSLDFQKLAFKCQVLDSIISLFQYTKPDDTKSVTWTLLHIVKDASPKEYQFEQDWIRLLVQVLVQSEDVDVCVDLLSVLSIATEGHQSLSSVVLTSGVVPHCIRAISSPNEDVRINALKVIGNIAQGPSQHTEILVQSGVLEALAETLTCANPDFVREALWTLSNLCADHQTQTLQKMIALNLFPKVVRFIRAEGALAAMAGLWTVSNILNCATWTVTEHLLRNDLIRSVMKVLKGKQLELMNLALDVLLQVLEISTEMSLDLGRNPAVEELEQRNYIDVIENLQLHPNAVISNKAICVIERYFQFEDSEEEMCQDVSDNGYFNV